MLTFKRSIRARAVRVKFRFKHEVRNLEGVELAGFFVALVIDMVLVEFHQALVDGVEGFKQLRALF